MSTDREVTTSEETIPNKNIKVYSEIRINGGFASVFKSEYNSNRKGKSIPRIRQTSVPFDLFLTKMSKTLTGYGDSREASIVPENCRYHEVIKGFHIVAAEEPPMIRTIIINNSYLEMMQNKYGGPDVKEKNEKVLSALKMVRSRFSDKLSGAPITLSFPYVVFMLLFNCRNGSFERCTSPFVFFKRSPLVGLSDPLMVAPLTNITGGFELCIGSDSRVSSSDYRESLPAAVKHYRRLFWNNAFNTDFMNNVKMYSDVEQLKDYICWHIATQENPSFIYSVPWKKSLIDFAGAIDMLKSRVSHMDSESGRKNRQYEIIEKAILAPVSSEKETVITVSEKGKKTRYEKARLYFDVSGEYYITPEIFLLSGDMLTLPNKKTILFESFLGPEPHSVPTHYRILINNKHRIIIPSKPSFNKFIEDSINSATKLKKLKLSTGDVVSIGDLIRISKDSKLGDAGRVKKIESIKVKGDNSIDIVLTGNISYKSESFPTFDKIDVDKQYVGKTLLSKIDKKKNLLLEFPLRLNPRFIRQYYSAKFKEVRLENEEFFANFQPSPGSPVNIRVSFEPEPLSSTEFNLIDEKEFIKVPSSKPINMFGRLVQNVIKEDYYVNKTMTKVLINPQYDVTSSSLSVSSETLANIAKTGVFDCVSFGHPLNFSIGDNVVIFDRDPLKMLTVQKIIGMNTKVNDSTNKTSRKTTVLNFMTQDQKGNTFEFPFVESDALKIGRIRKVSGSHIDLKYGLKIKAKNSNLPCFPKDSVNIIIAFIIDTFNEPMALLSNARTLWVSDINEGNFEFYEPKSPSYNKLEHSMINPSDFIIQDGDIVTFSRYKSAFSGLVTIPTIVDASLKIRDYSYTGNEKSVHVIDLSSYTPTETNLRTMERLSLRIDCIPSPRLKSYYKKLEGTPSTSISHKAEVSIPTLHGIFIKYNESYNKVIREMVGSSYVSGFSSEHKGVICENV